MYISPNWHQHVICLTPSWSTTKEFLPRHEISNNVVRTTRNSSDQPAHTFLLENSLTVKPPNILRQILDPFHTTISTFIQSCSENKVTQCAFCWAHHHIRRQNSVIFFTSLSLYETVVFIYKVYLYHIPLFTQLVVLNFWRCVYIKLGLVALLYMDNKGAAQPAHPHSLISAFIMRLFIERDVTESISDTISDFLWVDFFINLIYTGVISPLSLERRDGHGQTSVRMRTR